MLNTNQLYNIHISKTEIPFYKCISFVSRFIINISLSIEVQVRHEPHRTFLALSIKDI